MTKNNYQLISVKELKQLMDNDPDLCLIDVREQHEWDEQHIPDAVLIPKDEISSRISEVTTKKDQPIYLHCRSGMRSRFAADALINSGYTNVYSVEGGIMEWAQCGYPTV